MQTSFSTATRLQFTLSQLQQVPGRHRHPLRPHITISAWSNVHICQKRRLAKQDTQTEEEKWLEPQPVRCLLFSDWLTGKTNKVNVFVCFDIHFVCLCGIFVTVHASHCATAKKKKKKPPKNKTGLSYAAGPDTLHYCAVTPHPSSSTPPVSIWQGNMSRMREESASPGCCALANPDFMQCDTEEDPQLMCSIESWAVWARQPVELGALITSKQKGPWEKKSFPIKCETKCMTLSWLSVLHELYIQMKDHLRLCASHGVLSMLNLPFLNKKASSDLPQLVFKYFKVDFQINSKAAIY